jgi:glycosyltransferase involved in cell wall biosynthesis
MTGSAKRVLCFSPYPEDGPSVRHRISALRPGFAAEGIELVVWSFMTERLFRIRRTFGRWRKLEKIFWFGLGTLRLLWRIPFARGYDVVVIHREAFPVGPAWFEALIAKVNPRLVFDFDDAIWEPPNNPINQRGKLFSPGRVAEIMKRSRAISAGSVFLAEHARRHNPHVHLVPTSYPDLGGRALQREAPAVPVVYWIGNWGNALYLELIGDALAELARRVPYKLRVVGGSDVKEIRLPPDVPIEPLQWDPALEPEWLMQADIGIMPLPDTAYERGKCAFKLVQYMAAGLPVVASPVGANRDVVAHGETGFLANDTAEWVDALHRLVSDAALRQRMGQAGHARYRAHYSPEAVQRGWREILSEVAA